MQAYLDCFSGISGDMFLGALVDAGLALEDLQAELAKLRLEEFSIRAEPVRRRGLRGTKVTVEVSPSSPRRGPAEVADIIERSDLTEPVKRRALAVFERLAEAEARVHGCPLDQVHFHEIGAVDAIVDVVGVCAGLARLGVGRVLASPVAVGSGYVETAHGLLPVPAPASAELLKGVPLRRCEEEGELTTPTGAALLVTLAEAFLPPPPMRIERIGYGAGAREGRLVPNLLRLMLGTPLERPAPAEETIWVVETNLDDTTGEVLGYLQERLFAAGAAEVFTTPVQMKKSRPGVLLTVLVSGEALSAVEETLFTESTTFGLRRHQVERRLLKREEVPVETPYGTVRVKVGKLDGRVTTTAPEFEDCRRLARSAGVPIKEVYESAVRDFRARSRGREEADDRQSRPSPDPA